MSWARPGRIGPVLVAVALAAACSASEPPTAVQGTTVVPLPTVASTTAPPPPAPSTAAAPTTVPQPDPTGCPAEATAPLPDGAVIRLAAVGPLTGPNAGSAAVLRGLQAQLATVNEAGGVAGHLLALDVLDDGGVPERAAEHARAAADQGVTALVGVVGAGSNLAIRPVAAERCLPQLFVASGDPTFTDPAAFPWTLAGPVSFAGEAAALARHVQDRFPGGASVAVLGLDTPIAAAQRAAFDAAAAGTGVTVVAERIVPADATSTAAAVWDLATSDAQVLANLGSGLSCPRALADLAATAWRPLVVQTSLCSSPDLLRPVDPAGDGTVVSRVFKEPGDPRWAGDAAMARHIAVVTAVAPGTRVSALTVLGWTIGELVVAALERAAASPQGISRASVAAAAWTPAELPVSLVLPGVSLLATRDRGLVVTAVELATYRSATGQLEPIEPVVPAQ